MKKAILILVTVTALMSFQTEEKKPAEKPKEQQEQKVKVYTVTLTEKGVQVLFECLEQSNASHQTVKSLTEALIKQLQPQFAPADTTKPKK